MNTADIVILIIVILIVIAIFFRAYRKRHLNKSSQSNCCSGCAYKGFCGKNSKKR